MILMIINIMLLRLEMVAAPRQRAHRDSQSQRSDDGRRRDGSLRAIIIIIIIAITIVIKTIIVIVIIITGNHNLREIGRQKDARF